MPPSSLSPASDRLVSLDAYRGFVMLAMVSGGLGTADLLDDPKWFALADQLRHRDWVGCTFWDLIQPSFMFMVGVSMPFAFAKRQAEGATWSRQFAHAFKRFLLLIAIGIFLDSFGKPAVVVQFIRVLQQIAFGYLFAFLVLHLSPIRLCVTAGLILIGHTLAFQFFDSPSGDPWQRNENIGAWIDQTLHAPFAERGYDNVLPPSTGGYVTINFIAATATILFGVVCGKVLRMKRTALQKTLILTGAGLLGLVAGDALTPWVPLVKRIWTASFTLYAAGWTFLMMAAFFAVIDGLKYRAWSLPLVVVGMNSIFIYVSAGILNGTIRSGLRPFVEAPLAGLGAWTNVVMACLVVLVQWGLCYWLYRHRIFFKV